MQAAAGPDLGGTMFAIFAGVLAMLLALPVLIGVAHMMVVRMRPAERSHPVRPAKIAPDLSNFPYSLALLARVLEAEAGPLAGRSDSKPVPWTRPGAGVT